MTPILADAINLPFVLGVGLVVLIPLIIFEVFVEAFILKKAWHLPYGQLCSFAFFANLWSLLAGIPTKILNASVYSQLLPDDIPGFFARYPLAIAIGSFIYFVVTLLVEGVCASRWRQRMQLQIPAAVIWRGILLANIATYAVLAPLHYYATRPGNQIREFTNDTRWTASPGTQVLFTDASCGFLRVIQLDGTAAETIVPVPVADYLVSTNLTLCLFRGTNGCLYLYRQQGRQTNLIWKTEERFFMNQVAFSPSGERVAFASEKGNSIELVNVKTGARTRAALAEEFSFHGPSVAWSPEEKHFYIGGFEGRLRLAVEIGANEALTINAVEGTNPPAVLKCFGRTGASTWWGGRTWGVSYNRDECEGLSAVTWPGLGSSLHISRAINARSSRILSVSVQPGLLHLAGFYFGDVGFVEGCRECLFEANGYIYLLDIEQKRLGTLAPGDQFIQLAPRYEKGL